MPCRAFPVVVNIKQARKNSNVLSAKNPHLCKTRPTYAESVFLKSADFAPIMQILNR